MVLFVIIRKKDTPNDCAYW